MKCRRFLVSGRVQGVFFRASTQARATELGLRGHAKNLSDGRVEVVACGTPGMLDELEIWLRHGPPLAVVNGVKSTEIEMDRKPGGFTTA